MARPADGIEVLITCLSPLGTVGATRELGDPLPSWAVARIEGGTDGLVDTGTYSVHTFAATPAEAQEAAMDAYDRITALAPRWGTGQPITINSGTVWMDEVTCTELPRDVNDYVKDRTIVDYTATYRLRIRHP